LAQTVYGSTSLDIDPDTGVVTATCETDVDNLAAEYYNADVTCVVEDSNNNVVASGGGEDDSAQGYVQVVLTFTGVPGETYTAMSAHVLFEIYTVEYYEDPPQPIRLHYYDDMYDFSFYSDNPQTYDGVFDLESPGPETETVSQRQIAANTVATQIRYYTPSELLTLILSAQSLFAPHCDTVFTNVVPSYNNNGFFASLEGTTFIQYPPGAPNIPAHGSADAATQVDQPGRPIELFPNFYPTAAGFPAGFQEFILIHEGLHHFTGWYDFPSPGFLDFETQFFNSGYRNTTGTSNDFTVWLTSGCPPAS
jgi:hypothetical protein